MKIIGTIGAEFLLSADSYEIARIQGGYGNHCRPNVGDVVKVNEVYEHVRTLVGANSALTRAKTELDQIGAAIASIQASVVPVADAAESKLNDKL